MKTKFIRNIIIFLLLLTITVSCIIIFKSTSHESDMKNEEWPIKKISTYNNPIVPNGFRKIETDTASWELKDGIPKGWDKGLVIEDEMGNQFVWVPLDIENIIFNENDLKNNVVYDKANMNFNEREDLQILKYEGFYIGRYEVGISNEVLENVNEISKETNNISEIPVSKKNQIVWNYIDWNKAKENATKMYQNEYIQSDLVTVKQWNTIGDWLRKSGYNTENSIEWGNYSNNNFTFTGYYSTDYGKTYKYGENVVKQTYNMILSTGATERNKANNIYDLAGNVSEFVDMWKWENGSYGIEESYRTCGGNYDNISYYSMASNMSIATANSRQGFRVVLYQK